MKVKILLCTSVSLLLLCAVVRHTQLSISATNSITDVTLIPQGAYEQITLEHEGITDEEICRIYASDVAYWNKVDSIMCGD